MGRTHAHAHTHTHVAPAGPTHQPAAKRSLRQVGPVDGLGVSHAQPAPKRSLRQVGPADGLGVSHAQPAAKRSLRQVGGGYQSEHFDAARTARTITMINYYIYIRIHYRIYTGAHVRIYIYILLLYTNLSFVIAFTPS